MKKLLMSLFSILLFTGCSFGNVMNTPTKRVEEFLGKYQKMDKEVLDQLDDVLDQDNTMDETRRKEYRDLMKKQYQNLSYTIKDETVDGDTATVEVEIEVFDFANAIKEANKYLENNKDEFKKEENKDDNVIDDIKDDIIDTAKFIEYKIKQMTLVKEKIKYTLNLTLTKKDKQWVLDDITETERQKIHGLYSY